MATLDARGAALRRCRGRPRLTDSDRAQRRLESRKKYDVRRVYLGESHQTWSELRRRTGLSDAGLAEYLVLLDAAYGEEYQRAHAGKKSVPEPRVHQKEGKKVAVTSLQSLVAWYQEHAQTCTSEPQLRALEPALGTSTSALWQCDAGHSFVQHLSWPSGGASESEGEDEEQGDAEGDVAVEVLGGPVSNVQTRRRARAREEASDSDGAKTGISQASHATPIHEDQVPPLSQLPGATNLQENMSTTEDTSRVQAVWEVLMQGDGDRAVSERHRAASCAGEVQEPHVPLGDSAVDSDTTRAGICLSPRPYSLSSAAVIFQTREGHWRHLSSSLSQALVTRQWPLRASS
uniref:Zinc finger protein 653 n=1 Tax=Denticeps clupeoides TaxID=299321 RepID=A0AAY4C6R2_9TELE